MTQLTEELFAGYKKWVERCFINHTQVYFKDDEMLLCDDYTEIYLYKSMFNIPMIRIVNIEMVNEIIFISPLPDCEDDFIKIIELVKIYK